MTILVVFALDARIVVALRIVRSVRVFVRQVLRFGMQCRHALNHGLFFNLTDLFHKQPAWSIYNMRICIDVREAALIALLPDATVKPLVLGDITIEDDDGNDLVIIERKTVADLAASIKDGRYREQAARLTDFSLPNHNIMYLVEGTLRGAKLPMPCDTLMGAMVSLWYGKGFSVMRTESLEQTAQFLRVMLAKFIKEGGYLNKVEAHDAKRAKMDSITPDNIDALMLSQIPYVNVLTAEAVLHHHPTIARLTAALYENPDCLNSTMSLGEKPRKISSKSIESIKTFLLKQKACD